VIVIVCDSSSHGTTTFVVPLGPKPLGEKLSTAISTAVAFAVTQLTVTGAVVAAPQLRSPTSNEVTSAGDASVVVFVVPVVSVPESPDPPHPASSMTAAIAAKTPRVLTLTRTPSDVIRLAVSRIMTELREDVRVGASALTFLVDVDNTLLDNDRFRTDLEEHLLAEYGAEARDGYWAIQERRFVDLGYRDYLGAAQEWWASARWEPSRLALSEYLLEYPFADRLYPRALDVLSSLRTHGAVVVLTDGDAVFQPRKVARAGIRDVVDAVLVYVHKEEELDDAGRRHPARHYVLVDDKLRILTAAKEHWGDRVTTVLPLQGQFANDPELSVRYPAADVTLDGIAGMLDLDPASLADG
jgi:phosphoglycolate phosphatase-like HAD superfamily hydrolase